MIAHRRRAGHRPAEGSWCERGAALVEFAFLVPVLATLVFGTMEFGYRWQFAHEAVGASRAGARVGAGLGEDAVADYYILATIRASLDSVGMLDDLDRVIVYKANSDGNPPSGCLATSNPSGTCNIYMKSMINSSLSTTMFNATTGCYTGTGSLRQAWCSKRDREDDQRIADYLGVMVIVDTPSVTKMFPAGEARRRSVMRMEPPT